MLGEAILDEAAAIPAAGTFAAGAIAGATKPLRARFFVEEEEMLVDLKLLGTGTCATPSAMLDLTFFVDGVDQALLADGICRLSSPSVAQPFQVALERTVRLPKGEHLLEVRAKTTAGIFTMNGDVWPAFLTARRHSHPATSAANANAKVQGVY
ncbi:MAG TPA: hypothetical protein VMX11_03175 [Actinomycetes bacterium]|nr:hypothetical protein [Actinomycetes bacterium]